MNLKITDYGDDFTGASAVMEVLSFAGIPTMLFMDVPDESMLADFPDIQAFGVAGVRKDWVNVAKTHELSVWKTAYLVILPAAAPTILTGMRISIGIAWLVIVAAEMLVGGTGIGYYVWNEWNNLDLTSVIFSILMIGVVGMLLDAIFGLLQTRVTYQE